MPQHPRNSPQSLWSRLMAVLAFVAVAAALFAPVSMLAEEVRSGRLGGICSAGASWNASADADGAPSASAHCELCASVGLAMPPVAPAAAPVFAADVLVALGNPAETAAADPGLPFNRGPPGV